MSHTRRKPAAKPITKASRKAHTRVKKKLAKAARREGRKIVRGNQGVAGDSNDARA
jgi:hypothetical protein